MIIMKKLLCMFMFALFLIYAALPQVYAEEVVLSELNDEECITFVKDNDIELPMWYEDETVWVPFIRFVISKVEDNPNAKFGFGHTVLLRLANDIKYAVISYYGLDDVSTYARESSTSNILQDNIVHGTTSDSYDQYNCYAYAIGLTEWTNPGEVSGIAPADVTTASELAGYIVRDLKEMGYTDASKSSIFKETNGHTKALCIRTGTFYDSSMFMWVKDYHVMKCESNGLWYHKPGETYPLRYKYTPSNNRAWVYETYDGTVYQRDTAIQYDSNIYYVTYTASSHTWAYLYCGSGQHVNTCTICGDTSGEPADCVYLGLSANCAVCFEPKSSAKVMLEEESCRDAS